MNMTKAISVCVSAKIRVILGIPKSILEYIERTQSCKDKMAIMYK